MKCLAALVLGVFCFGAQAQSSEFDQLKNQVEQYHSSEGYKQNLLRAEHESAARQQQSYNAKILGEAKAFARYHGGLAAGWTVTSSAQGAVALIDLKTRDGLTSRCVDYAYRLTCECIDPRTLEMRKVEFRSAYGGIEKRVN